jgi:hypothetical protein
MVEAIAQVHIHSAELQHSVEKFTTYTIIFVVQFSTAAEIFPAGSYNKSYITSKSMERAVQSFGFLGSHMMRRELKNTVVRYKRHGKCLRCVSNGRKINRADLS